MKKIIMWIVVTLQLIFLSLTLTKVPFLPQNIQTTSIQDVLRSGSTKTVNEIREEPKLKDSEGFEKKTNIEINFDEEIISPEIETHEYSQTWLKNWNGSTMTFPTSSPTVKVPVVSGTTISTSTRTPRRLYDETTPYISKMYYTGSLTVLPKTNLFNGLPFKIEYRGVALTSPTIGFSSLLSRFNLSTAGFKMMKINYELGVVNGKTNKEGVTYSYLKLNVQYSHKEVVVPSQTSNFMVDNHIIGYDKIVDAKNNPEQYFTNDGSIIKNIGENPSNEYLVEPVLSNISGDLSYMVVGNKSEGKEFDNYNRTSNPATISNIHSINLSDMFYLARDCGQLWKTSSGQNELWTLEDKPKISFLWNKDLLSAFNWFENKKDLYEEIKMIKFGNNHEKKAIESVENGTLNVNNFYKWKKWYTTQQKSIEWEDVMLFGISNSKQLIDNHFIDENSLSLLNHILLNYKLAFDVIHKKGTDQEFVETVTFSNLLSLQSIDWEVSESIIEKNKNHSGRWNLAIDNFRFAPIDNDKNVLGEIPTSFSTIDNDPNSYNNNYGFNIKHEGSSLLWNFNLQVAPFQRETGFTFRGLVSQNVMDYEFKLKETVDKHGNYSKISYVDNYKFSSKDYGWSSAKYKGFLPKQSFPYIEKNNAGSIQVYKIDDNWYPLSQLVFIDATDTDKEHYILSNSSKPLEVVIGDLNDSANSEIMFDENNIQYIFDEPIHLTVVPEREKEIQIIDSVQHSINGSGYAPIYQLNKGDEDEARRNEFGVDHDGNALSYAIFEEGSHNVEVNMSRKIDGEFGKIEVEGFNFTIDTALDVVSVDTSGTTEEGTYLWYESDTEEFGVLKPLYTTHNYATIIIADDNLKSVEVSVLDHLGEWVIDRDSNDKTGIVKNTPWPISWNDELGYHSEFRTNRVGFFKFEVTDSVGNEQTFFLNTIDEVKNDLKYNAYEITDNNNSGEIVISNRVKHSNAKGFDGQEVQIFSSKENVVLFDYDPTRYNRKLSEFVGYSSNMKELFVEITSKTESEVKNAFNNLYNGENIYVRKPDYPHGDEKIYGEYYDIWRKEMKDFEKRGKLKYGSTFFELESNKLYKVEYDSLIKSDIKESKEYYIWVTSEDIFNDSGKEQVNIEEYINMQHSDLIGSSSKTRIGVEISGTRLESLKANREKYLETEKVIWYKEREVDQAKDKFESFIDKTNYDDYIYNINQLQDEAIDGVETIYGKALSIINFANQEEHSYLNEIKIEESRILNEWISIGNRKEDFTDELFWSDDYWLDKFNTYATWYNSISEEVLKSEIILLQRESDLNFYNVEIEKINKETKRLEDEWLYQKTLLLDLENKYEENALTTINEEHLEVDAFNLVYREDNGVYNLNNNNPVFPIWDILFEATTKYVVSGRTKIHGTAASDYNDISLENNLGKTMIVDYKELNGKTTKQMVFNIIVETRNSDGDNLTTIDAYVATHTNNFDSIYSGSLIHNGTELIDYDLWSSSRKVFIGSNPEIPIEDLWKENENKNKAFSEGKVLKIKYGSNEELIKETLNNEKLPLQESVDIKGRDFQEEANELLNLESKKLQTRIYIAVSIIASILTIVLIILLIKRYKSRKIM